MDLLLILEICGILVAYNIFDRLVDAFCSWRNRLEWKKQDEESDRFDQFRKEIYEEQLRADSLNRMQLDTLYERLSDVEAETK